MEEAIAFGRIGMTTQAPRTTRASRRSGLFVRASCRRGSRPRPRRLGQRVPGPAPRSRPRRAADRRRASPDQRARSHASVAESWRSPARHAKLPPSSCGRHRPRPARRTSSTAGARSPRCLRRLEDPEEPLDVGEHPLQVQLARLVRHRHRSRQIEEALRRTSPPSIPSHSVSHALPRVSGSVTSGRRRSPARLARLIEKELAVADPRPFGSTKSGTGRPRHGRTEPCPASRISMCSTCEPYPMAMSSCCGRRASAGRRRRRAIASLATVHVHDRTSVHDRAARRLDPSPAPGVQIEWGAGLRGCRAGRGHDALAERKAYEVLAQRVAQRRLAEQHLELSHDDRRLQVDDCAVQRSGVLRFSSGWRIGLAPAVRSTSYAAG